MKHAVKAFALFLCMSSAYAADVGQIGPDASSKGDFIRFTDEDKEFCTQGSKLAVYVTGKGKEIPGCWMVVKGKVHMEFADGDSGVLDRDSVDWKPGMKPAQFTL